MNANEELAKAAKKDPGETRGLENCHRAVIKWFEKAKLLNCENAYSILEKKLGSSPQIASKVLVRPQKQKKYKWNQLRELKAGYVVGFYGWEKGKKPSTKGRWVYGHSMVVCQKGKLAGVNNLNVATIEALQMPPNATGYMKLDVNEQLAWNNDGTIGPLHYNAFAEDAQKIADRINAELSKDSKQPTSMGVLQAPTQAATQAATQATTQLRRRPRRRPRQKLRRV